MAKLTDKQKRFCLEYIIDCNATQAAIRAGYSEKTAEQTASRMLSNVKVSEYIQELMESKNDELIASGDEVLETLTRIMRREEKETVVVVCKERKSFHAENGKKVIEEKEVPQLVVIPTKVSDVNRAAELLGKRYQLYTDKISHEGIPPITFVGGDSVAD